MVALAGVLAHSAAQDWQAALAAIGGGVDADGGDDGGSGDGGAMAAAMARRRRWRRGGEAAEREKRSACLCDRRKRESKIYSLLTFPQTSLLTAERGVRTSKCPHQKSKLGSFSNFVIAVMQTDETSHKYQER